MADSLAAILPTAMHATGHHSHGHGDHHHHGHPEHTAPPSFAEAVLSQEKEEDIKAPVRRSKSLGSSGKKRRSLVPSVFRRSKMEEDPVEDRSDSFGARLTNSKSFAKDVDKVLVKNEVGFEEARKDPEKMLYLANMKCLRDDPVPDPPDLSAAPAEKNTGMDPGVTSRLKADKWQAESSALDAAARRPYTGSLRPDARPRPKPGCHPQHKYECLVFKGGGAKGSIYPGAIRALEVRPLEPSTGAHPRESLSRSIDPRASLPRGVLRRSLVATLPSLESTSEHERARASTSEHASPG